VEVAASPGQPQAEAEAEKQAWWNGPADGLAADLAVRPAAAAVAGLARHPEVSPAGHALPAEAAGAEKTAAPQAAVAGEEKTAAPQAVVAGEETPPAAAYLAPAVAVAVRLDVFAAVVRPGAFAAAAVRPAASAVAAAVRPAAFAAAVVPPVAFLAAGPGAAGAGRRRPQAAARPGRGSWKSARSHQSSAVQDHWRHGPQRGRQGPTRRYLPSANARAFSSYFLWMWGSGSEPEREAVRSKRANALVVSLIYLHWSAALA
jgi:hypothetical protein